MTQCPACSAPVSNDHIVEKMALCSSCSHIFEVKDLAGPDAAIGSGVPTRSTPVPRAPARPAPASPARPASAVQPAPPARPTPPAQPAPAAQPAAPEGTSGPEELYLPMPMNGVRVTPHGAALEITVPWKKDLSVLGWGLQIGIVVVLTGMVLMEFTLWPLPVIAFLAYSTLTYMQNKTTFLLTRKGMQVYHGPLPSMNQDRRVSLSVLHDLQVVPVKRGYGRHRRTDYSLETRNGDVLTNRWNRDETLAHVRCIIDEYLRLCGPPPPERSVYGLTPEEQREVNRQLGRG